MSASVRDESGRTGRAGRAVESLGSAADAIGPIVPGITEGGPEFALVEQLEDALPVLPAKCSNTEAERASGLSLAFERSQLAMFAGLKTWQK